MSMSLLVAAMIAFIPLMDGRHIEPFVARADQPLAPGSGEHVLATKTPLIKKCPTASQDITQFIQTAAGSLPTQEDIVSMIQGEVKTYPIIGSPQTWKANFDKVYPPAAEQKTMGDKNATTPLAVGKVRDLYTKCQYPGNLSYCGLVDYKVPFYGWYEWAQYQEQCLEHYIEYYYKDPETSPECIESMKAMGCAAYFPRCEGVDAEGRDLYLKPCRSLCQVWKYDLKCPGSEQIDCKSENPQSINFARYGSCTDYGAQPMPPPVPNATKAARPTPTVAPAKRTVDTIKQVEQKNQILMSGQPVQQIGPKFPMFPSAAAQPQPFKEIARIEGEKEQFVSQVDLLKREGGGLHDVPTSMTASEVDN